MIQRAARRAILAAYILLVLAATLAPLSGDMYVAVSGFDKLVHVGLFAGVALLFYWSRNGAGEASVSAAFWIATFMAGMIEVIQGTLRYRSGDLWDFVAGAAGAAIGAAGARLAFAAHRARAEREG